MGQNIKTHPMLEKLEEVIESLQQITRFKSFKSQGVEDIELFKAQIKELNIENIDLSKLFGYNGDYDNMAIMILNNQHFNYKDLETDGKNINSLMEKALVELIISKNVLLSSLKSEKEINPNYSPVPSSTLSVIFKEEDKQLDPRSTNGSTNIKGRYSSSLDISKENSTEILNCLTKSLKGSSREKFIEFVMEKKNIQGGEEKKEELLQDSLKNNMGTVTNKLKVDFYKTLREFENTKNSTPKINF